MAADWPEGVPMPEAVREYERYTIYAQDPPTVVGYYIRANNMYDALVALIAEQQATIERLEGAAR